MPESDKTVRNTVVLFPLIISVILVKIVEPAPRIRRLTRVTFEAVKI